MKKTCLLILCAGLLLSTGCSQTAAPAAPAQEVVAEEAKAEPEKESEEADTEEPETEAPKDEISETSEKDEADVESTEQSEAVESEEKEPEQDEQSDQEAENHDVSDYIGKSIEDLEASGLPIIETHDPVPFQKYSLETMSAVDVDGYTQQSFVIKREPGPSDNFLNVFSSDDVIVGFSGSSHLGFCGVHYDMPVDEAKAVLSDQGYELVEEVGHQEALDTINGEKFSTGWHTYTNGDYTIMFSSIAPEGDLSSMKVDEQLVFTTADFFEMAYK